MMSYDNCETAYDAVCKARGAKLVDTGSVMMVPYLNEIIHSLKVCYKPIENCGMCGIYFSCSQDDSLLPAIALQSFLENRGPDCCKVTKRTVQEPTLLGDVQKPTGQPVTNLTFLSTVLYLRGDIIVEQPLVEPTSGSILCWNGEAWKLDGNNILGNDAVAILDLLSKCTDASSTDLSRYDAGDGSYKSRVIDAFSRVVGPYAFVYYDAYSGLIFYGRDTLGRRSLLVNQIQNGSFAISSICDPDNPEEWVEVEPNSIHVIDPFAKPHISPQINDERHLGKNHDVSASANFIHQLPPLNKAEPGTQPSGLTQSSSVITDLERKLHAALQLRVGEIPSVPCGQATWPRLAILFSGGLDCALLARVVHNIVPFDQEIDLLNVAFENPRVVQAAIGPGDRKFSHETPYALCPDRITGISSHLELMTVCPERRWRFVSIDVPYLELKEHRSRIISLIHPHKTEMDLSIASALYFAARASGTSFNEANNMTEKYTSRARVLLSGLGADEIFAGYQRHATAFHRGGYSALIDELDLDINRLGKRNLGRDDRVISNWGKEARYPYLDEEVVSWALSLPVWEKCGFGTQPSLEETTANRLEPGKRLLRLLASKKGLYGVALEKKRAIQFGARTAKMEIGKVKGTQDIS